MFSDDTFSENVCRPIESVRRTGATATTAESERAEENAKTRNMSTPLERRFEGAWTDHLSRLREVELEHGLDVQNDPALRFSVPRIVCIGEESSGKSSTLERIAMMNVFPSDERLCTRVPIELRLRYTERERLPEEFRESGYVIMKMQPGPGSNVPADVSEPMSPDLVAANVRQWMDALVTAANGRLMGVAHDRIIIELYSSLCVNLDLIDLPGIVAGSIPGEPADMMQQTRDLSASFLDDAANPHTFVIAVASARDARIRNSQAMELVQRYNKVQFTIGALTMADLSADSRLEDPYQRLEQRLRAEADDTPELGLGYVALKNRDTVGDTNLSLEDANEEEKRWFNDHLPNSTELCGIDNLIDRLVRKVEEYTTGTWLQAERGRILNEINATETCRTALGEFLPNDLAALRGHYSSTINKWQRMRFSHLMEYMSRSVVGSDFMSMLPRREVPWDHPDRVFTNRQRSPPAGFGQTQIVGAVDDTYKFDIHLFDNRGLSVPQWSRCTTLTQADLFDIPNDLPGFVSAPFKTDGFNKLCQHVRSLPANSLFFIGRRDIVTATVVETQKVVGMFFTGQQLHFDAFRRLADSVQVMKACHTTDATRIEVPTRIGVPTSPSAFFQGNTFRSAPRRAVRPQRRTVDNPFRDHDDFIVIHIPQNQILDEGKLRTDWSQYSDDYYQRLSSYRISCIDCVQAHAREVFDGLCEALIADLREKDDRFDLFIEGISKALNLWADARTRSVMEQFRNMPCLSNLESLCKALDMKVEYGFNNLMTKTVHELIFFEAREHCVVEFLSTSQVEDILRTFVQEKGVSMDELLVENCAEERARLTRRLCALTDMKNALFTSPVFATGNENRANVASQTSSGQENESVVEEEASPVPTVSEDEALASAVSRTSL